MIVRWSLFPTAMLCVALVTTTSAYFVGLGEAPQRFFGGEDVVIVGPSQGVGGPKLVPPATVRMLQTLEGGSVASAEALAPTVINGKPVLVRVADPADFLAIEQGTLVAGRLPSGARDVMIGERAARWLDLAVADLVAIPGAFAASVEVYEVVGVFRAPRAGADEVLAPPAAASALTGGKPGDANIVRVRTDDPDRLRSLLSSTSPEFTLSGVSITPTAVVPGETAIAHANVTNWGLLDGIYTLTVREGGSTIATSQVLVPAMTTVYTRAPFTLAGVGFRTVTINPEFRIAVRPPSLHATELPTMATRGDTIGFRVIDAAGAPAVGARASFENVTSEPADGEGRVKLTLHRAGAFNITLARDTLAEPERGVGKIRVVAPEHQFRPYFVGTRLHLQTDLWHENETVTVRVFAQNIGGEAGEGEVRVLLDGRTVGSVLFRGAPGEHYGAIEALGRLPPGRHNLTLEGSDVVVPIRVWSGLDPRVDELLRLYRVSAISKGGGGSTTPTLAADAYAATLVGNVTASITFLALATGALGALGLLAGISRHLRERAGTLATLKSIGAPDTWILDVATREILKVVGAAALGGLAAGTAIFHLIDRAEIVRGMGHVLSPALGWRGYALVFLLTLAAALAVALVHLRSALSGSIDDLARGGPVAEPAGARALRDALEGEP